MDFTSFFQERNARISPRTLSDNSISSDVSAKGQGHQSSGASKHVYDSRVKLMCSHGGKIFPRPSDMKLRYVGGETRMVSVPRNISYATLLKRLQDIYVPDIAVKYQLPEEDLDALVSVTSDEDVENMMEECDRLDAAVGSSKLRVFVFSSFEPNALDLNDLTDSTVSQQRYVDAVNQVTTLQVEGGLRKSDDSGSATSSGHIAYTGDMPQNEERVFGLPEHLRPFPLQGNPMPKTFTSLFHTTSSEAGPPPWAGMLGKEPIDLLELASSEAAEPRSLYGAAAVATANDFRDLESGESASSSISSQYDIYNKFLATHRWALSSQMHPQMVDPPRTGSGDDQLKRAELPHGQENTRKGVEVEDKKNALGMSPIPFGKQMDVFECSKDDGYAKYSNSKMYANFSACPGEMLHKELSTDEDLASRQPPQTVMKEEHMGRNLLDSGSPPAQDNLLADGHPDSNILRTQPFPHHQFLAMASDVVSASNSVLSSSSTQPVDKTEVSLEQTKLHNSPLELPAGFSELDYSSTGYNHDGQETNQLSMFASQPFSHYAYNVVTQPCSSDLSPSVKKEMEEFLQQVLSPTMSPSTDMLLHDFDYAVSSQAPWLSPASSFPLVGLDQEKVDESSTWSQLENTPHEPVAIPKTQIFDRIQDDHPLLSRVYSPGLLEFGDLVQQHGEHVILPGVGSLEELSTQGEVSNMLAKEDLVSSDLVVLRSSSQLDQGYDDDYTTSELSLGAVGLAELSIDQRPADASFTSDHILKPLPGFSLHGACSSKDDSETEPDIKEMECRVAPSLLMHTSSPTTQSVVEASSSTVSQLEHELPPSVMQPSSHNKALDDPELSRILEKEELKSDVDEGDTFESAIDMWLSPVAAAEVEAIARDLQIIRHFDLEELRELGSGTFGTVYHGKWRGTDVAIKRIKSSCFMGRPSERERLIADFWREAHILGQLHHPNVVAFYGVVPDGPGGTLSTVTEYMVNGSLKQALRKDRTLDRRKRLLIAMDAAFGMEYLHGKKVIHFDLKCENLLVNLRDIHRPVCKVADLGLSKIKQQTLVSGGVRGTLPWMAPELLNGSSSLVSEKVDVFSFGIVLWELLTGEEPYASLHYGAIIGGIVSNTLRPSVPRWCDPAWKSLMEVCWSADPAERPTFPEIVRRLRAMEATLGKDKGPMTTG